METVTLEWLESLMAIESMRGTMSDPTDFEAQGKGTHEFHFSPHQGK
jgi:hypothetical protein